MDRRHVLSSAIGVTLAAAAKAPRAQQPPTGATAVAPRIDFLVDPRRTAFLNVDMQNCFVEGYPVSAPEGPALLRRLNGFAATCRAAGVQVIHTAHVLRSNGSNAGLLKQLPEVDGGMLSRGSHSAALHKDLVVAPEDIMLEKPRFGAFQGTDLEMILHTAGIDTVVVGGIATNVCCETTAREAAMRDFKMLFLSDGTATFDMGPVSAAQIQAATCATLRLFGQVLTLDEMTGKLRARS
ncbi:MAG TPA: isochorismatase family cysteine hydrolase [Gammaproteobacteria bacterium]|nr:isochorismatase family cysteine hydrolase [Gammaproteobacteria bacterium]